MYLAALLVSFLNNSSLSISNSASVTPLEFVFVVPLLLLTIVLGSTGVPGRDIGVLGSRVVDVGVVNVESVLGLLPATTELNGFGVWTDEDIGVDGTVGVEWGPFLLLPCKIEL